MYDNQYDKNAANCKQGTDLIHIIGGFCVLIAGIVILIISIKEIKREGIAGSIFSAIIDAFLGIFHFSIIGGVLFSLLFIIIGISMLVWR